MTALMQAQAVSKRYGRRFVLRSVSLDVSPGEIVGLLGRNGAGKSTLLRIMSGIERADSGTVTRPSSLRSAGNAVGALIDARWLDGRLTCSEHVELAHRAHGIPSSRSSRIERLRNVGLGNAARTRVARLSLGMRQRLGLCLATMHDPDVLLLDEPVNGLDPDGVLWLRNTLTTFAAGGGGVILSSHLMAEMERVADRVVVLEDGTVRGGTGPQWGSCGDVIVRTEGPADPLRSALIEQGGDPQHSEDGGLRVAGVTPAGVFLTAVRVGVVVTELRQESQSLEDYYRATTDGGSI